MKKRTLAACSLSMVVLWGIDTAASNADAQVTELDETVEELRGLIPPEYHQALATSKALGEASLETCFPVKQDQADCRTGLRFGKQLATSFMRRVSPTCHRLLSPIGDEWLPDEPPASTRAFRRCFDFAWSERVTAIVFDTAEACAWQGFESTLTAAQVEYNRCYLEVARHAQLAATFIAHPFEPGRFALVPRDDARWDAMLGSLRAETDVRSGLLTMACEVGKSDAEAGLPPSNLLTRPREPR